MLDGPQLQGEKVILRRPLLKDSPHYFRWINDQELVALNGQYKPVSQAAHDQWFNAIGTYRDRVEFSILARESCECIGSLSLRNIDRKNRNALLQIRVGERRYWGAGYGTEAVRLLVGYAFDTLDLNRVGLHVFCDNPRAIAAYKKVGFQEEGVLREAAFVDGAPKDLVVMGLLKRSHAWSPPNR